MNSTSTPVPPALLADRFKTLRYDEAERAVIVLDRRTYPFKTEYITLRTVEAVAEAIENMTVQGGPPLAYVAGLGLALAARDLTMPAAQQTAYLESVAQRLIATRPTADDLHRVVPAALDAALIAFRQGADPFRAALDNVNAEIQRGNEVSQKCGQNAARLVNDGDQILTHCIAGAALCWMLWTAKQQGKAVTLVGCETRPYFQGARLTAASALEMGIPFKLITDGMSAHLMSVGKLDKFICAADRVTLDGHITNKIGTLTHAIAAHHFGKPFYVLGYDGPDPATETGADIPIEERSPAEIFVARGETGTVRTAVHGIDGYYPAFDITPPHLISAIVTDRGIFAPHAVREYFSTPE
ncbi:MAG TPA: s-methyl-5-thioribose-1-phosphate isomerase [Phototrophicaceae bacterium]|nr:s-methyl-5-thioribose-1-phosphate isomerase [Phototrophicaceae bacterium]